MSGGSYLDIYRKSRGQPGGYSKRGHCYGEQRHRPPFWERQPPWRKQFKGGHGYSSLRGEQDDSPTPPKRPEVPKEELAKVLKVKSVNFHLEENMIKHRTDRYKMSPPELVVRRGDGIKLTVTFDRQYSKEKDDMNLLFSLGKNPSKTKNTLVKLDVDESGKMDFSRDNWKAVMESKKGNDATIIVHIPSDCIIGEWNLTIVTIVDRKVESGDSRRGEKTKETFDYLAQDVTVLFNPWCTKDGVYLDKEEDRQEYVLNQKGLIYVGCPHQYNSRPWNFGQFEKDILDASLDLVRSGYKEGVSLEMSKPESVSRMIAQMVNSKDDDGVLIGNWSRDYSGGKCPTKWNGSVHIMRQYKDHGPVKYGQCWVFSGVTTTVCRALGIPCRPVTNFSSGHDIDGTNVIEFYSEDGERDSYMTVDSIWNYHVWNEVWMARPDLVDLKMGFEFLRKPGWQVIDATPQEKSFGVFRCGPSPVRAIRAGYGSVNYDTNFVFSEVNANVLYCNYLYELGEYETEVDTKRVGTKILTKKANKDTYEDLTFEYKPKEGTKEEEATVAMALEYAKHKTAFDPTAVKKEKKMMKFNLLHENDTMIGNNLKIEVTAKNNGSNDRKILSPKITVAPFYYYGYSAAPFFTKEFEDMVVKKGQEIRFSDVLETSDYLSHTVDQGHFVITATAKVEKASGEKEEFLNKTHYFVFRHPELKITGPTSVKKGQKANYEVSFKNPLNIAMTNCDISMDSSGFVNFDDRKQADVPPNGVYKQIFQLEMDKEEKKSAFIVFNFDCDQVLNIGGCCEVNIF